MNFKDYLATFPSIEHLNGLDVCDENGNVVHQIPAIEGKLGSLKLYNALAQQFDGTLNAAAAEQGLTWFAEHTEDALQNPNKHPNVDLLLRVKNEHLTYTLKPNLA